MSVDSCDTGYTGNPSVNELTCQDTGSWSNVTGCTIVGKLQYIQNIIIIFMLFVIGSEMHFKCIKLLLQRYMKTQKTSTQIFR